ncbi:MAG: hypothetical protein VX899_27850 [Myxococcota bacterium]|nr:hypothetical protein [Myxococcota bacterium]
MWTLLLSLGGAAALAQQAPAADAAPAVAGPTDAELHELEARALYQVGLELVISRQYSEAKAVFERIQRDYPGSSVATDAARQLEDLAMLETRRRGLQNPAAAARAELVIEQTVIGGLFLGALVPGSTWQPSEPGPPVLLGLTGATAAGVGSALFAKKYEPSTGQVMSLFTGELLGAANGFALSALNPPRDYRGLYRETLGGTVLGAAAGSAAAYYLDPDAGQVAMVNSGMLWGGYYSAWTFAFWESNDPRWITVRTVGGMDAGAAIGAVAAHYFPVSRSRMNVINLAGMAGTAVAGGAAILANFYGSLYEPEPTAAVFLAGTTAGLVAGAALTRNMDAGDDAQAGIPGGVLVGVYGDKVGFGVPLPAVVVGPNGQVSASMQLAAGRF